MNDEKALFDFINARNSAEAIEAILKPWLADALEHHAQQFGERPGYVYRGPCDFVLKHGTWFTKVGHIPERYHMPEGGCYGTAMADAVRVGAQYFEGLAVRGGNELCFHAWTTYPQAPDLVIDRTWAKAPGMIYVGVPFSVERAADCAWHGDGSVLQDNKRGDPLFKQRWEGEPPGLVWPPCPPLEVMRHGDKKRALPWLLAEKEKLRRA